MLFCESRVSNYEDGGVRQTHSDFPFNCSFDKTIFLASLFSKDQSTRHSFNITSKHKVLLYSVRRLKGSLWTDIRVITITNLVSHSMCLAYCLEIMGRTIFDNNRWLVILSVIQLCGWQCTIIKHHCQLILCNRIAYS